jgi:hypothetical protein
METPEAVDAANGEEGKAKKLGGVGRSSHRYHAGRWMGPLTDWRQQSGEILID